MCGPAALFHGSCERASGWAQRSRYPHRTSDNVTGQRHARGVVRHEDDLAEPQLGDDGVEVTDLIVGGVRVAGWLIRTAPPEEIK